MVVLIDANIILDYILKREPFYADAQKVMQLCSTETVDG
ncbi:PIN domain-containing protein [Ruminococcus callidus]